MPPFNFSESPIRAAKTRTYRNPGFGTNLNGLAVQGNDEDPFANGNAGAGVQRGGLNSAILFEGDGGFGGSNDGYGGGTSAASTGAEEAGVAGANFGFDMASAVTGMTAGSVLGFPGMAIGGLLGGVIGGSTLGSQTDLEGVQSDEAAGLSSLGTAESPGAADPGTSVGTVGTNAGVVGMGTSGQAGVADGNIGQTGAPGVAAGSTATGAGSGNPGTDGSVAGVGTTGTETGHEGPAPGGGDGGGGSRVICTELVAQGLLDKHIQMADAAYTYYLPNNVYQGYLVWAIPYVRLMRKYPLASKIAAPIALARGEEIAYQMGWFDKGNFAGKLVRVIGEPICYVIGMFAAKRDWRVLNEDKL